MRTGRSTLIAMSVAVMAVLMTSVTAYAAMDATLSSTQARPGDWILLLTDDHNGTWDYQGLSAEGGQPLYLAPVSGDFAAGCGSPSVARLEWRGNRAGVAFLVPNLPLGDYYIFMETSSQCWRLAGFVAGTRGPLVLSIGNVIAANQTVAAGWTVNSLAPTTQRPTGRSADTPWLSIVGVLCGIAALSLYGLWKRGSRVAPNAIRRQSETRSFSWSEDFDESLNFWFWLRRTEGIDDATLRERLSEWAGEGSLSGRKLEQNMFEHHVQIRDHERWREYLRTWQAWKRIQVERQIENIHAQKPDHARTQYKAMAALGVRLRVQWVMAPFGERWLLPPDLAVLGVEGATAESCRQGVLEAARSLANP
jgi:hypothetical protein